MSYIRKISIGRDLKNAMHYVVGKPVLDESFVIDTIIPEDDGSITIWIEKNREVLKWKRINPSVPVTIEYNIDF